MTDPHRPDSAPSRDARPHVSLQTTQATTFGHGWISGMLATLLGLLGLGAVLCFQFPSLLTAPELRRLYPLPEVRAVLHVVLVSAFLLGAVSVCLRHNKALGLAGMGAVLLAALLGGSQAQAAGTGGPGPFLGLDWFLLNLIGYSAVYVPLERMCALHPEQPIFRRQWRTDLTYFAFNSLLIQVTSLLTLKPALVLFTWAQSPQVVAWISSLPTPVQIVGVLLVADFTQYWVHRAFHVIPVLWRFHEIHHSAEQMDWLAGSRLHIVDAVVTRATTYIPIYVLGFSERALIVYIVLVAVQATFIHANVDWPLPGIRRFVATPMFHHWHHSAEPQAVDKNFAVHTPLWDWLFGTYYQPDRWPSAYGLASQRRVPEGWLRQLVAPFRRRSESAPTAPANTEAPANTVAPRT